MVWRRLVVCVLALVLGALLSANPAHGTVIRPGTTGSSAPVAAEPAVAHSSAAAPRRRATPGKHATSLGATGAGFCATTEDNRVWCWGSNIGGALGDGTGHVAYYDAQARTVPIQSQAVGQTTSGACAVSGAGAVQCWGGAEIIEDGDASLWSDPPWGSTTPQSRGFGTAVKTEGRCALLRSGGVQCYGNDIFGELGVGSGGWPGTDYAYPVPASLMATSARNVVDIGDAVDLSAYGAVCALRESGRVLCWGSNYNNGLGRGDDVALSGTPIPVPGLTGAVALHDSCATRADGTAWCWSSLGGGAFGDGGPGARVVPAFKNATDVAVNRSAACAVLKSGSLVCLGSGIARPGIVPGIDDAAEVDVSGETWCVRRLSGGISCWGKNRDGELGRGFTSAYDVRFAEHAPVKGFVDTDAIGVAGLVVRGTAPGVAADPASPVAGIGVQAEGVTTKGDDVVRETSTDDDGGWSLTLQPGTYTVSFPAGVCVTAIDSDCVSSQQVIVTDADQTIVDALVVGGVLETTIAFDPKLVELETDPETGETIPQKVATTMTIKNTGTLPVRGAFWSDELGLGWAPGFTPDVPELPLRGKATTVTGPIEELAPGKKVVVPYELEAHANGTFEVTGWARGEDDFGTVRGHQEKILHVAAPELVTSYEMGRSTASGAAPSLLKGGTPYTIKVTYENRSYDKRLYVEPAKVTCIGNASGCSLQYDGLALGPPPTDSPLIPQAVTIEPRGTLEMELVVYTTNIAATVLTGATATGGGTRSEVELGEPDVYEISDDDELMGELDPENSVVLGETHYRHGVDVRDLLDPPEWSTSLFAWSITRGVFEALYNLTVGMVSGLFQLAGQLPEIIVGGSVRVAKGLVACVQATAEMWDALRHDPDRMELFMAQLWAKMKDAGYRTEASYEAFVAGVQARYKAMWDAWYVGDWPGAVRAMTAEGVEHTVDVATALIPGMMARSKLVRTAVEGAQAKAIAKGTRILSATREAGYKAADAIIALKKVTPGFEFTNLHLRRLYGLTAQEANFLRTFAKDNQLIITIRSRAKESVKWLEERGAVLKPESIKIKTVNETDARWLGFRKDDVGRVVIRKHLPVRDALERRLRSAGLGPGDGEWVTTMKRWEQRREELTKTKAGYYKQLKKADKDGYIEMHWNFKDNAVDPKYATEKAHKYEFRMNADKHGNLVPEFKVKGKWRSITGDVDFLAITKADGSPLSDLARVEIYKALAKSPVGLLHPETATWILEGLFNFETKVNEFVRGGTVAQFGPDKIARAVTFNPISTFIDKLDYQLVWNGGFLSLGTTL
ncbi:hypothetical protein [Nocardioides acrostichi]|uniref:Alpha-tubulin suppressor-like RCC1 family protein n=1 Tax=Nocardioides acrostichi TaxID=2784339 RepID=A0A930Y6R2_9ACTN|nr:hypothetical protein [Nocardioides acrostichi]MBF4161257.1 hypothetical protein [Nocardioides acrostichi]